MTANLNLNVLGILSWMKEQSSTVSPSLDEVAARFGSDRDEVRLQLQSLQRYECVKRGGREKEEWSITDQGLVRLAEARFTRSGDFLPPFQPPKRSVVSDPEPEQPFTMIAVPQPSHDSEPETEEVLESPYTLTSRPRGFFRT